MDIESYIKYDEYAVSASCCGNPTRRRDGVGFFSVEGSAPGPGRDG